MNDELRARLQLLQYTQDQILKCLRWLVVVVSSAVIVNYILR